MRPVGEKPMVGHVEDEKRVNRFETLLHENPLSVEEPDGEDILFFDFSASRYVSGPAEVKQPMKQFPGVSRFGKFEK